MSRAVCRVVEERPTWTRMTVAVCLEIAGMMICLRGAREGIVAGEVEGFGRGDWEGGANSSRERRRAKRKNAVGSTCREIAASVKF